jgi:hypothetical protein
MNKLLLRNHLNNFVGEGCGLIPRWAARLYGESDWPSIKEALADWQREGFLTVLNDPETSDDNTIVAKMHNFIDASEPLPPGWIDEKKQPPTFG